jgi:hypothetical protein
MRSHDPIIAVADDDTVRASMGGAEKETWMLLSSLDDEYEQGQLETRISHAYTLWLIAKEVWVAVCLRSIFVLDRGL